MIRSCIVFLIALGVLLAGCSTDYSKYIAELDKYTKILEETARLYDAATTKEAYRTAKEYYSKYAVPQFTIVDNLESEVFKSELKDFSNNMEFIRWKTDSAGLGKVSEEAHAAYMRSFNATSKQTRSWSNALDRLGIEAGSPES